MIPVQITSRDFPVTEFIRSVVMSRAKKLEQYFNRIIRCEVVLSSPHRHKRKGRMYHVEIRLHVPGPDIVATREAEEDSAHEVLAQAIHDAFLAVQRRLEDRVREMRGFVKTTSRLPRGRIKFVSPELDYGFIETDEGDEIYFHRNSVKGKRYDDLKRGEEVQFHPEMGEEGPQASYVRARKRRSKKRLAA